MFFLFFKYDILLNIKVMLKTKKIKIKQRKVTKLKKNNQVNTKKSQIQLIKVRDTNAINIQIPKYNNNIKLDIKKSKTIVFNISKNELNKINKILKFKNIDLDKLLLLNPYEILTYKNINNLYYISHYLQSNKQHTNLYNINDNIIIPMYRKYNINIYDRTLLILDMLKDNNILDNKERTILNFDIFGPVEIIDKTLYIKNDLLDIIDIMGYNDKYELINIYDCYSWGKNMDYDKIKINNQENNNTINNLIKKIKTLDDIKIIENYILTKTDSKKIDICYIRNQNYFYNSSCEYQYFSLKYLVNQLIISLPIIKKSGVLIISINTLPYIDVLIQLLYIVSGFFSKTIYYSSKLDMYDNYIIFKNFIGINEKSIQLLYNIRNAIDDIIDININYDLTKYKVLCVPNLRQKSSLYVYVIIIVKNIIYQ
jgi:hypothetical protein